MTTASVNRQKIQTIRRRMVNGQISYIEAKQEAQPIIDDINEKAAEIAKKYGMRPSKVSFAALMR